MATQVRNRISDGQMLLPLGEVFTVASEALLPTLLGNEEPQLQTSAEPVEFIGPHVNLEDRARSLARLLPLISDANKSRGLVRRAETEAGYKGLEARYGKDTPTVVRGSKDKSVRLEREVKSEFSDTYGTPALYSAGEPLIEIRKWEEEDLEHLRHTNPEKRKKRLEQAEAYLRAERANQ